MPPMPMKGKGGKVMPEAPMPGSRKGLGVKKGL